MNSSVNGSSSRWLAQPSALNPGHDLFVQHPFVSRVLVDEHEAVGFGVEDVGVEDAAIRAIGAVEAVRTDEADEADDGVEPTENSEQVVAVRRDCPPRPSRSPRPSYPAPFAHTTAAAAIRPNASRTASSTARSSAEPVAKAHFELGGVHVHIDFLGRGLELRKSDGRSPGWIAER